MNLTDSDLAILYKWTLHTRNLTWQKEWGDPPACMCEDCKESRRLQWMEHEALLRWD